MYKKSSTYFLIVLVIVIWGGIGYKIYTTTQGNNMISDVHQPSVVQQTKEDTFSLLLNYPDPFTKKREEPSITRNVSTDNHASFNINKPLDNNSNNVPPPNIKYVGLVKNEIKKTGMLLINGKSYLVHEGQKIDSIKVIKFSQKQLIYKDSKNKLSTIPIA